MVGEPNASREFREHRGVRVALVDVLEMIVGRVEKKAARELFVLSPCVEKGRGARQVLELREQAIQLEGSRDRLRERARDTEKELLRRLEDESDFRVLQEVAVVDGTEAEVLELLVALREDRVVQ